MAHHVSAPSEDKAVLPKDHFLHKVPNVAVYVAVLALFAGWVTSHDGTQFAYSYLTAFLYVASLALGSLFFVLAQHAGRAGWSVVVRRIPETFGALLPLMVFLFLPVFFARHDLYHHWMGHHGADDPILAGKAGYLNEGFWNIRAALYLIIWAGLGWFFHSKSVQQDTMGGTKLSGAMERWSYRGIVLFALSVTFAAIDWAMSLDPHWFSTMWGVYYFAGSMVGGYALMGVFVVLLLNSGVIREFINEEHLHDVGKYVFAFTIFWTYIAFSQFFLIWYSNIPEETAWFHHRGGTWVIVGVALMIGHFALPFLYLLPRGRKRNPNTLLLACLWMLVFHYVDIFYIVMPSSPLGHHGLHVSASDILTVLGLTSFFLGAGAWLLSRNKLVPVKDPRLPESLAHVNF